MYIAFFTRPRGNASFTDTTITSPTVAQRRFEPPRILNAQHAACTRVVGYLEVGFRDNHWSCPCSSARVVESTSQVFDLEIGLHSRIRTFSPVLHLLSGSCAANFFERRIIFLYSGCWTWRSTRTVTVLSALSVDHRSLKNSLGHRLSRSLGHFGGSVPPLGS